MKQILLILLLGLLSCSNPKEAATKTCTCLEATASLWQKDEKMDAFLKFGECGKMQEDYKKQFNGSDLAEFEQAYDQCLQETIKGELFEYLIK
jgi:hypothetical protein